MKEHKKNMATSYKYSTRRTDYAAKIEGYQDWEDNTSPDRLKENPKPWVKMGTLTTLEGDRKVCYFTEEWYQYRDAIGNPCVADDAQECTTNRVIAYRHPTDHLIVVQHASWDDRWTRNGWEIECTHEVDLYVINNRSTSAAYRVFADLISESSFGFGIKHLVVPV